MTQPGTSPGYAMLARCRATGMEVLSDPDGNGQLNASTAGGASTVPKWLKLSRRSAEVSEYWFNDGDSWTQVGSAVTLEGIADPQEEEPEPETPGEPLTCVTGPVSNEFDSPALLPTWACATLRARRSPSSDTAASLSRPGPGRVPLPWARPNHVRGRTPVPGHIWRHRLWCPPTRWRRSHPR